MKRTFFIILMLCTTGAFAEGRFAFTASAVRSNVRREIPLSYRSNTGFGSSLDYFWTPMLATEVAASWTKSNVMERAATTTFHYGSVRMMPLTASLQFHFTPLSPLDVYLGGGAGWLRLGDLKGTSDLADLDIDRVRFKSRTAAMGQAGLTIGSWRGVGLNIDAKYIDAKTKSEATFTDGSTSTQHQLRLSPWLWSAGLRWRF